MKSFNMVGHGLKNPTILIPDIPFCGEFEKLASTGTILII
jgi:hypothetical protein